MNISVYAQFLSFTVQNVKKYTVEREKSEYKNLIREYFIFQVENQFLTRVTQAQQRKPREILLELFETNFKKFFKEKYLNLQKRLSLSLIHLLLLLIPITHPFMT